jgi:hypothetical protein
MDARFPVLVALNRAVADGESLVWVMNSSHVGYLGGAEGYSYGNGKADPTEGSHDMW